MWVQKQTLPSQYYFFTTLGLTIVSERESDSRNDGDLMIWNLISFGLELSIFYGGVIKCPCLREFPHVCFYEFRYEIYLN